MAWELSDLVTPMAIRVAATLRIADHIADGLRTAPELARAEAVDADALDRVLRHLVTADVLGRDESGRYSLTERGEPLREGHASGLRATLDMRGALGRAELAFVDLLDTVRTGAAAFPKRYGQSFWDALGADPEQTAAYDAQMGADVKGWAQRVVPAFDWGRLEHVIDVGGGNGTLLCEILRAHEGLRGTLFDQPQTAAAARETLRTAGLADRTDVVSGSFFDALPRGGDGYVLCAVLHDWDDDSARAILRRCAEAAGPTGRVLVIEKTGAGGESPNTAMDLRMLVYFGARERGASAISALAKAAGLRTLAVHPAGDLSIVELAKP